MYKQRNTYWIKTLDKARKKDGGWFHTDNIYTLKTARQLCCDIRHGRRVQGFKAGEVWDADWYFTKPNDETMCAVKIRIVTLAADDQVAHIRKMCGATPLYDVWETIEQFSNI